MRTVRNNGENPDNSVDRNAGFVAACGMNCGICSNYPAGIRDIRNFGFGVGEI
jgi:hypothetical protein